MHHILLTTLLLFQTPPTKDFRNPNLPPRTDQPPGTNNPLPPGTGNQMPPNGNQGVNVMVDGMYTILAYEKFGQPLPGMANLKVVIRNNIMTFPGDTKMPGKMLQLRFGPGNTITITLLDGRTSNPWQPPINQAGDTPPGQTGGVNQAGQSGTSNQSGQTGNNIQTGTAPGQPAGTPPNNNQTGNTPWQDNFRAPNSERGVYVLSMEFFCISVTNNMQTQVQIPDVTIKNNQNPPANKDNGQFAPPRNPTPPNPGPSGSPLPSQAVLVLKRVAN